MITHIMLQQMASIEGWRHCSASSSPQEQRLHCFHLYCEHCFISDSFTWYAFLHSMVKALFELEEFSNDKFTEIFQNLFLLTSGRRFIKSSYCARGVHASGESLSQLLSLAIGSSCNLLRLVASHSKRPAASVSGCQRAVCVLPIIYVFSFQVANSIFLFHYLGSCW